jgi:hypothetical protein
MLVAGPNALEPISLQPMLNDIACDGHTLAGRLDFPWRKA